MIRKRYVWNDKNLAVPCVGDSMTRASIYLTFQATRLPIQ